jgi:hypothetical protein
VLHEVDVRLADCSSDVGFSDALFFCATGTDGTCFGDSGGPLMIERKDGTFRQIGISSFSDPACAHFHVWTNIAIGPVRSAVEDAIEALDGDGRAGEASDAAAPDTRITKAPGNKVRARHKRVRVSIRFTANEASDFTCALDGKAAHRCGSPQRLRVKKGQHRFKVFATDSAGNDDPTPARATWRVKRVD